MPKTKAELMKQSRQRNFERGFAPMYLSNIRAKWRPKIKKYVEELRKNDDNA